MGSDRSDAQGRADLTRIAQVVPNLPTFAVDDGFSYRVPDTLSGVSVGSIVRVPLGGRKVRGFVTHVRETADPAGLKDVLAVVGDHPVFTPQLLETLRWASVHYVAPLAALLAKAAPPNVARRGSGAPMEPRTGPISPLPDATAAAASGRHLRAHYLVTGAADGETLAGLTGQVVAAGRNAAILAPTVTEARTIAAAVGGRLGITPWLVTSSEPAKEVTKAWVAAETHPGQLIVGTRELAFWPLGDLGIVVVVEEGRPAMKAPQTPTTSVRDVLRRRAGAERFVLVFAGPVPTVESLAAGVAVQEPQSRVWPLVEIADRTHEPPGRGVITDAALHAIRGVMRSGARVFVFVSRRGDAAAFRCVQCGELRRCPRCGAAATQGDACQRCEAVLGACGECGGERFQALGAGVGRVVAELRRSLGERVGRIDEGRPVIVGTERDVPLVGEVGLAVVVDADALILAPHYRAEEDALRLMARIALLVGRGRGRRCLIQSSQAAHRVLGAMRHGRPVSFLRELLAERESGGFPPVTELVAIEVVDAPQGADGALREIAEATTVHGPAPIEGGARWLAVGADLRPVKIRLRGLVQRWRDSGARVRVDADPVRL